MAEHRPDVAREAPEWMYPYLGGMVDATGAFTVSISKNDRAPNGYAIQVRVRFRSRFGEVMGMILEIAEAHGWNEQIEKTKNRRGVTFQTRDDVKELLTLVEPFVVGRAKQVQLLLDVILPALEARKHYDKESFVELMDTIGEFREVSQTEHDAKYDAAYFRDLWDLN
jgi:hypothetical protein